MASKIREEIKLLKQEIVKGVRNKQLKYFLQKYCVGVPEQYIDLIKKAFKSGVKAEWNRGKKRGAEGRAIHTTTVYFVWSKTLKKPLSPYYGRKFEAERWRNNAYFRYAEFPILEDYMSSLHKVLDDKREKTRWELAKNNFLTTEVCYGVVEYKGDVFEKERLQWVLSKVGEDNNE